MALGTQYRLEDGSYQSFAWPGGYPVFYICADNGVICPKCANDNHKLDSPDDPQWNVVAVEVNWEDDSLYCDNCSEKIDSAYYAGS